MKTNVRRLSLMLLVVLLLGALAVTVSAQGDVPREDTVIFDIDNQDRQSVLSQRAGGNVPDLAQPCIERLDDQFAFAEETIDRQAIDVVIPPYHDDG